MENRNPNLADVDQEVTVDLQDDEDDDSQYSIDSKDFDAESEDELSWRLQNSGFSKGQEPCDAEKSIIHGQTWNSWEEFNQALDEYEGRSGWMLHRRRRNKKEFRGVCRGAQGEDGSTCKVMLHVRLLKRTGLLTVRKCHLVHTCNLKAHKFRNGSNRVRWVAKQLLTHVKINRNASISQLNDNLMHLYDTSSSGWSVQRARAMCREELMGGSALSFQKIPAYCEALKKVDDGVHAYWQTGEEKRFARLYVAPSSSQHVFNYCRPLVGLDGAHTSGKYPMVMLLATCFDGENHVVILAWGVVRVENGDNWEWFLEHLRRSYPEMRNTNTVLISDRDKGLKKAVADVFPEQAHSHCVQHIKVNVKGVCDVQCAAYFGKIAEARTESEFEKLFLDFEATTDRQQKFIPYVRKINPNVYARHCFPKPRYGHNTSNIVEVINGEVKPARSLPALFLSHYLWNYVMEKHYERAEFAKSIAPSPYALTEYASSLRNRLYGESRKVKEKTSSPTQGLMLDKDGEWALRMHEKHCDCTEWREMDFPCKHAIRFMSNRGQEVGPEVGEVWKASNQVAAYEIPVPPLSIDHLEVADTCFEPMFTAQEKAKGKSKKWKPSYGDQMAREYDKQVRSQHHRCSKCKLAGHNARRCPSFPIVALEEPRPSHHTVRVGAVHSAVREDESQDWLLCHTRTSTIAYSDFMVEQQLSQTGPSQVTQS